MVDIFRDDSPQPDLQSAAGLDDAVQRGYDRATQAVGRLDRSASGKLALSGREAAAFLTGQVTADVEAIEAGHGSYAVLLTSKGKVVADLRVLSIADEQGTELELLCERSGLQDLFDHLRRHLIGFDAELHKRTIQQGLISLVGPDAVALLGPAAEALGPDEHDHLWTQLDEIPLRVIRTNVGIDLLCDADATAALDAALERRGAPAVPSDAIEIVRVESGRPRLHQEMDDTVMPAEVGIVERAVSFTKGCYVGQETVARLHWRGRPNRHLRGLLLDHPVPDGTVLVRDGRELGRVTTSVQSPRHGPIALALVRREVEPGQSVDVRPADGAPTHARVIALPFPNAAVRPLA